LETNVKSNMLGIANVKGSNSTRRLRIGLASTSREYQFQRVTTIA